MAAVMIGGMVPPIAIALCSTFFKNRFTSRERKSAAVNYIMGLSFITEGAIPFAASDPLRVIPACAIDVYKRQVQKTKKGYHLFLKQE